MAIRLLWICSMQLVSKRIYFSYFFSLYFDFFYLLQKQTMEKKKETMQLNRKMSYNNRHICMYKTKFVKPLIKHWCIKNIEINPSCIASFFCTFCIKIKDCQLIINRMIRTHTCTKTHNLSVGWEQPGLQMRTSSHI